MLRLLICRKRIKTSVSNFLWDFFKALTVMFKYLLKQALNSYFTPSHYINTTSRELSLSWRRVCEALERQNAHMKKKSSRRKERLALLYISKRIQGPHWIAFVNHMFCDKWQYKYDSIFISSKYVKSTKLSEFELGFTMTVNFVSSYWKM